MSSNTRGRNMVKMVIDRPNQSIDTPDSSMLQDTSKKELTTKKDPVCNIHDFGGLWAHEINYDNYSKILTPKVEYASTLNMTQTFIQKQLDLLNREYDFHEMPINEPEGNMDEATNGIERIMVDAYNEAEENMDETNNKTEGNMGRERNEIEGIVNDTNNETAGNMDEATNGTELNREYDFHETADILSLLCNETLPSTMNMTIANLSMELEGICPDKVLMENKDKAIEELNEVHNNDTNNINEENMDDTITEPEGNMDEATYGTELNTEYDFHDTADSLSLLCNETFPSSVMNVTLVNLSMEFEEICPDTVSTENIYINKEIASERQKMNDEHNSNTNYLNEENMDKAKNETEGNMYRATNGTKGIMENANYEAKENMDETKNNTEGNMDRETNRIEGIVNDENEETAENMDEASNGTEGILDDANNEAKDNIDETNNDTEGNMDKATNGMEGNVDEAIDETVGNMDEENKVNEENNAQDNTNQELQENNAHDETNENIGNTSEAPKGTTKSGKPRIRRKYEESVDTRNDNKKRLKLEKSEIKIKIGQQIRMIQSF